MRVTAFANAIATGWARSKGAASPPHMTVSAPLTAPAWPPETGASMKCRPRPRASAYSSRATRAEAVVSSNTMASLSRPAKAPSAPSMTLRRSSSLPTHEKTICASAAASRGVRAARPPNSSTHWSAFLAVRL